MIVKVTEINQNVLAELCASLWPHNTVKHFIHGRNNGDFQNEYLYYINDEAVAFMSLSLRNDYVEGTSSSPVGYLEGIFVKPEYRKRNVARELVEYAKSWSLERGCIEFASDCLIENIDSRNFHNKIGFKEANTIVCFVMDISGGVI